MTRFLTLPAAALTLAFAAPVLAESNAQPQVSFADAVTTVTQAAQGDLVAMELDYAEDSPIYVAELLGEKNASVIILDATTGAVIGSEVMTAQNDLAEAYFLQSEMDEQLDALACLDDDLAEDIAQGMAEIDAIEELFEAVEAHDPALADALSKALDEIAPEHHDQTGDDPAGDVASIPQ